MHRRWLFVVLVFLPPLLLGQEAVVPLPKPQTEGGKPLMTVLRERKSTREFSPDTLPHRILSNLLWAAFGVNRAGEMKRTAPSARNWQEIDIYLATSRGLYLFNARDHSLMKISEKDMRAATGAQPYVGTAPLNLVYVADLAKLKGASDADKNFYPAIDAGFIAENVYLYCASEGLGVVVRGMVDREKLAGEMHLRPDQRIIVSQTVGFPKK